MRVVCAVLGIVLSASACFAQGEILDRRQSAVFVQACALTGENIMGGGGSMGYSFKGAIDLGVTLASTRYSYNAWRYSWHSSSWSHSLFVNEHIIRYEPDAASVVIVSLHQAYGWQSGHLLDMPGDHADESVDVGASGTIRAAISPTTKLLFSVSYAQGFSSEDPYSVGVFEVSTGVAFPTRDHNLCQVAAFVNATDERTTVGGAISLLFITRDDSRERSKGSWQVGENENK